MIVSVATAKILISKQNRITVTNHINFIINIIFQERNTTNLTTLNQYKFKFVIKRIRTA